MKPGLTGRKSPLSCALCVIIALLFPNAALSQQPLTKIPGISLIWTKSVGGLKSIAISPQARHLALLTDNGKLALWAAQDGTSVWATVGQTSSRVVVSDGNGFVLAYSPLSLVDRTAYLRQGTTGALIWKQTYSSALWSAAFSPTASSLVIGNGDDSINIFDLTKPSTSIKIPVIGTPVSIQFDPSAQKLYVGHWDRSGVSCFDFKGNNLWNINGEVDRTYKISRIGPRFLTYISSSNRQGKSPITYVVRTEKGTLLWVYSLDEADRNAIAQTTDTADETAISYAQPLPLPSGIVVEQRLAMIDRSGQMIWEKGGLFWAPTLISLTPDEDGMVVYDGDRSLYRLDSQGRTVAKAVLSDVLRMWTISSDNSSLVVYTHDGQLSLLHIQ